MWTSRHSKRFMVSLGGAAGLPLLLLLFFVLDISSTGAQQPTPTVTKVSTIIITVTVITATPDPTVTNTPTAPGTVTPTPPTITATTTPGPSPTVPATIPPTTTLTPGPTETLTPEPTATVTATATGTLTPGPSPTGTATLSPTVPPAPTPSLTLTSIPTITVTPVPTTTITPVPTTTITATPTPTVTTTATPLPSLTPTITPTTVIEAPVARETASARAVLPRTIAVIGQGAIAVETDLVQVEIGVEAFRPLMQEVQVAARDQMEQVLAALRAQGVADDDIQTASVDVHHEPARDQEGAVAGYRLTHTLQVTLRDLERAATILDAAAAAGASRIIGLHFRLDNQHAWEMQALVQALDDAEARARQIAAYYGFELGDVVQIRQLAAPAGAGTPATPAAVHIPLSESVFAPPGRVQLSVQVEVVFTIRN